MSERDWLEIPSDKATALIAALGLKAIPWSTLDSTWYFREIEWADEEKTTYAFPGKSPLLVASWYEEPVTYRVHKERLREAYSEVVH